MKKCFLSVLLVLCLFAGIMPKQIFAREASSGARLNLESVDMTVGTTFTIRVYNLKENDSVSYSSSKEKKVVVKKVAKNQKSAVLYGSKMGKSKITVTVRRKKKVISSLMCRVKVAPEPVSVMFNEKELHLDIGKQFDLTTILFIKPGEATEKPVLVSSDTSVATVTSDGIVSAVAPGRAEIKATILSNGLTATCAVEVGNPEKTPAKTDPPVSASTPPSKSSPGGASK